MSETHIPVLRNEVIDFLKPKPEGIYVDATIGLGGHSLYILKESHPTGRLIGIDMDANALAIAEKRLQAFKERFILIHGNFAQLQQLLKTHRINEVDGVLLDLGVSSLQLDTPNRGFSFQHLGPLDMRMDVRMPTSAAQIVNESSPDKLIKIFKEYGEERYAKRIVRHIVVARAEKPITSTLQLAEIVATTCRNRCRYLLD
jgi:16S rRNA (cytosine1402-N4)-methyltransferase